MSLEQLLKLKITDYAEQIHSPFCEDSLVDWLDAALEYWLMRHRCSKEHEFVSGDCVMIDDFDWDNWNGWQCNCLEDDHA